MAVLPIQYLFTRKDNLHIIKIPRIPTSTKSDDYLFLTKTQSNKPTETLNHSLNKHSNIKVNIGNI